MKTGLKLYRFEASKTVEFLVAAESEEDAVRRARGAVWTAFDDYAPEADLVPWGTEIEDASDLQGDEVDDIPYGDNPDDKTAAELLEAIEGNPPPSEDRGPVHWCSVCHHERVQFDPFADSQVCRTCRTPALEIDAAVEASC